MIDTIHEILNNHLVQIPRTMKTTYKVIKQEDLLKISEEINDAITKEK